LKDIDQQLELKKPDEKHLLTDMSTLALMTTVRKASRIEGKAMKHSKEKEGPCIKCHVCLPLS
jgi:hypothetical protein